MKLARSFFLKRSFHGIVRPMLDFKQIVKDAAVHRENARMRNMPCRIDAIMGLYERYRALTAEVQSLETERKRLARNYTANSEGDLKISLQIKEKLSSLNGQLEQVTSKLLTEGLSVPNLTCPFVPIGDLSKNQEISRFGPPIRSRQVQDHVELGKRLDILDFEAGAKVAGSQQYFLKNRGALLELALVQYAIKACMKRGFQLMFPPDMAYASYVQACGFDPRREDAALPIYTVHQEEKDVNADGRKKALIGTAEVPVAAYFSNEILDKLPLKVVAFSHCFRPEVGHHGAESRGLYRVHQFSKVEMFSLTHDDLSASKALFEEIIDVQREILEGLELSCRVLNMATEELGASAYYKYDVEAWFPFGQRWGELTSASNCTDFQSRRLAVRYREGHGKPLRFPHTLNGTACAVTRTIQAIMENFQKDDGSIAIPSVLHPFMLDGSTSIQKIL